MPKLPMTALLLVAAVSTLSAKDRTDERRAPLGRSNQIEWVYGPGDEAGDEARIRFFRRGMQASLDADEAPDALSIVSRQASGSPGDAVSFAVRREPGVLTCSGTVTEAGRGAGTCRFDPDEGFVRALAARGVELDRADLLGLTLVDAHVASVDGLKQAGFRVSDSGDLMTVSALQVTPEFAAGLKTAGLEIDDLDNLVSARAVGVDAEWLSAMAAAGYPGLDAEQAIAMRSLGVTPDYAQRMARVLASTEGN